MRIIRKGGGRNKGSWWYGLRNIGLPLECILRRMRGFDIQLHDVNPIVWCGDQAPAAKES